MGRHVHRLRTAYVASWQVRRAALWAHALRVHAIARAPAYDGRRGTCTAIHSHAVEDGSKYAAKLIL